MNDIESHVLINKRGFAHYDVLLVAPSGLGYHEGRTFTVWGAVILGKHIMRRNKAAMKHATIEIWNA